MASEEEIKQERLKKLAILKKAGLNPYPADTDRNFEIGEVIKDFADLETKTEPVILAGRVLAIRGQGAIVFINIFDGTGKIQGLLKEDEMDKSVFKLFGETVDLGDFIEVTGSLFTTKRGEKTLKIAQWKMLTKSLLPLPEKWHGLTDDELRFRKRYLDILMNEEVREMLKLKARFWQVARQFLIDRNFIEVDTPTLELTTGGAEATPFATHHNDFDLDVYLRISVGELWQKRLMAGGLSRTFEIGRVYRNEGSSPEHLQEFTNLEFYASFLNFEDGKELVKEFYRTLAREVFGRSKFEFKGHTFDLEDEWVELDYVDTVLEMTGVNVLEAGIKDLEDKLKSLGVVYEGKNRERLMDSLWKYCRKDISGPAFLVNHPKEVAPLSKENPDNPKLTKTFQVILAGSEIGRAHAELNDPEAQALSFKEQKKLIEEGDTEAMMPDYEFIEMLEHGMPPVFGFGFGERFFSYLYGKNIRETQTFPLMKPKDLDVKKDN